MSNGIDYGMGQTNVDRETGIRFGVIPVNEVCQAWSDSSEADYGVACCPKCGNEAVDSDEISEDLEEYKEIHRGREYACDECKVTFDGQDAFGDEPNGWVLDDGEYKATSNSEGDIFILKSPYYTKAAFCSPCAPGACYLTSPCEDGAKAYCFGHDWFDGGVAPYPVYSVETNKGCSAWELAVKSPDGMKLIGYCASEAEAKELAKNLKLNLGWNVGDAQIREVLDTDD